MAPKAIIETVDQISKDTIDVRGVFTDEVSFKATFSTLIVEGSESAVVDSLRRSYKKAIAQDDIKVTLKPGITIDLSDPIVIPPPKPTPEEQARIDYFDALGKVQRAKIHVDLKIIDETQSDYAKLVSNAQALFKPEYLT